MELRDKNGLTEAEFLAAYDENRYRHPSVTVDMAIFTRTADGKIGVMLIKRANHPFLGGWALPGGFVDMDEDIEEAARRELMEETGVTSAQLKQVHTFGAVGRDPRTRVISVLYTAVLDNMAPCAGDDAADARLFTLTVRRRKCGENRTEYDITAANDELGVTLSASLLRECDGIYEKISRLGACGFASDHGEMLLYALMAAELAK